MNREVQTLIIGAGPSGLAVGAALQARKQDYWIVDRGAGPGGAYRKMHAEIQLVSPPSLSHLKGMNLKTRSSRVSVSEYFHYLENYVQHFEIHAQYLTEVTSVTLDQGRFHTQIRGSEIPIVSRNLVLATGMADFPKRAAELPDPAAGVEIQLALDWRGSEYYRGKKVLVCGSGTSALELAVLSSQVTETLWVTRGPPKTFPLETLGINFHYWIRGLEQLPVSLFKNVCNRKWKEPAIDVGLSQALKDRRLRIRQAPVKWRGKDAFFSEGIGFSTDILIDATGYSFSSEILVFEVARNTSGEILIHGNQSPSHPGLYFVGFPCSHRIDSRFLRGIRRDALDVASLLSKPI